MNLYMQEKTTWDQEALGKENKLKYNKSNIYF